MPTVIASSVSNGEVIFFAAVGLIALFKIGQAIVKAKKRMDLNVAGTKAEGRIVEMHDTGGTINNSPRIRLKVEVTGVSGETVTIEDTVTASRVSLPRLGDKATVIYEPEHPEEGVIKSFVASSQTPVSAPQGSSTNDAIDRLEQLGKLHKQGVLTDEQFAAEKKTTLARLE